MVFGDRMFMSGSADADANHKAELEGENWLLRIATKLGDQCKGPLRTSECFSERFQMRAKKGCISNLRVRPVHEPL